MKNIFNNIQLKKYLPIFLLILSLVILLGTSYGLLKSSQQGSNKYTMNAGLLEVDFFNTSSSNNLQLSNAVPKSDEEGMSESNELVFTIKNTGEIKANYDVYIEETTATTPAFASVIRYIDKKGSNAYGSPKTLSEDNYIEQDGTLEVGDTVEYRVKAWLNENADNTYMNRTFQAKIVVVSRQYRGYQILCPGEGCYYTWNDDSWYTSWNTSSQTPTTIDPNNLPSGVSTDYNDVGNDLFIAMRLNSSNQVEHAYTCGIVEGTTFCIEGTYEDNPNLLTIRQANIDVVTPIFGSVGAYSSCGETIGYGFECVELNKGARIFDDGGVSTDYGGGCYVNNDGTFDCI